LGAIVRWSRIRLEKPLEETMSNLRTFPALAFLTLLAIPLAAIAGDAHSKGPKPVQVLGGEEMQLSDYLVPGKTTVFDFHSEFCPPCREIAPMVEKLHETRDDIAVVEVDINRPGVQGIDWKSPVAREFNLDSIPHFKIFGPDGKLKAEGDSAYDQVLGWLKSPS
jgi:thiol-disulfide isomerase/thioredoxin